MDHLLTMNYDKLEEKYKQIAALDHALTILDWDDLVMMPEGGATGRADATASLVQLSRELKTSAELHELLAATKEDKLDPWQTANRKLIERDCMIANSVPEDLLGAHTRAAAKSLRHWRVNRARNDWANTVESFTSCVHLTRLRAQCLAETMGISIYDSLMDRWEPGLRQNFVDGVFEKLRTDLPGILQEVLDVQELPVDFEGPFSKMDQLSVCNEFMNLMGFDFTRGRLDTSHHPFSTGFAMDSRQTTRFNEADFAESVFATIHETGHSLYTQGLPLDWSTQPVGQACGMMIHESQSLFMEMQLCRGEAFLEHAFPIFAKHLRKSNTANTWNFENFKRKIREVRKSYIRVNADEVSYPLHILLRYDLEKLIIAGDLAVPDIPDAWDESMRKFLDLPTGGEFKDGCMQDIHWFDGTFGYFPCYSLGAITAAQFFEAMKRKIGSVDEALRTGSFEVVRDWLRKNIHSKASLLTGQDLIEDVTSEPLSTSAYFEHLKTRYLRSS